MIGWHWVAGRTLQIDARTFASKKFFAKPIASSADYFQAYPAPVPAT